MADMREVERLSKAAGYSHALSREEIQNELAKYSRGYGAFRKPQIEAILAAYGNVDAKDELRRRVYAMTGYEPSEDQLAKYETFINDPALLQSVVARDMALAPAKGAYSEDINATIKGLTGRDATASELNYFGKQMEQGGLDTYGLESFIKGTEEYQTAYTKKARQELTGELGASDQAYLDKVNKSLQAKYAGQGRSGAGAFGSSLIQAGKDLAAERGSYLANIGYQGAQQGADILKGQYQQALNDLYNRQSYGQGLSQESRNRYYSAQDAQRQLQGQMQLMGLQNQYQQQLLRQQQSQQPSFLQGLIPGLVSAGGSLGGAAILAKAYRS